MIDIMAENYGISSREIPDLIKKFTNRDLLVLLKDDDFYYKVSQSN
jgi:hypothetical protein